MKKITPFFLVMLIAFSVFAQNDFTLTGDLYLNLNNETVSVERFLKSRHGQSAVLENPIGKVLFEDDFSTPDKWVISNDAGNNDNWIIGTQAPRGEQSSLMPLIKSTTFNNGYAMFDSDYLGANKQDANLTASNIDCSGIEKVHVSFQIFGIRLHEKIYFKVSNDGGNTWNTIEILPELKPDVIGYNPNMIDYDITEFAANQPNVSIRFNYYSPEEKRDYAWMMDDIMVYEYAAPELTDFEVIALRPDNSMAPLAHAVYSFGAIILNDGADLSDPVTLNFSLSPGDFSHDLTISPPFEYNKAKAFYLNYPNYFYAQETGIYTLTTSAIIENDPTPENNTSLVEFEVTENTFATDNGIVQGGIGANGGTFIGGNVFQLMKEDIVTSLSVGFGKITNPQPFSLSIYSVDTKSYLATKVFETGTFQQTTEMSDKIVEFDILDRKLAAGVYFFSINQKDNYSINCGIDMDPLGRFFVLSSMSTITTVSDYGNIMVRVHTATAPNIQIKALTPADKSKNISLTSEISALFDSEIQSTKLDNIRISPNPGGVKASIKGALLQIEHNELQHNTNYTVTIPANTINGYTLPIEWSFTTLEGSGIGTTEISKHKIYYDKATRTVIIKANQTSTVKVYTISGSLADKYSIQATLPLNISLQSGIYIIQICNQEKTETSKIIVP